MNVKTARALRDLLSIILAACKDKELKDMVRIWVKLRESSEDQCIVIVFKENNEN